jgi:predicted nucleic acid-binding protein
MARNHHRQFSRDSEPMAAERVTYLGSSAIIKLAVREVESSALRSHLRCRRPLVSRALARAEVVRALLPLGDRAVGRGRDVLSRLDLVRINDRVLASAGKLPPAELRSLDAIHLATAQQFDLDLRQIVTYDDRIAIAAKVLACASHRPADSLAGRLPWMTVSQPGVQREGPVLLRRWEASTLFESPLSTGSPADTVIPQRHTGRMKTLTFEDLVLVTWEAAHHHEVRSELVREVSGLLAPFSSGAFSRADAWPYPPDPKGILQLPGGRPVHGAFARPWETTSNWLWPTTGGRSSAIGVPAPSRRRCRSQAP